MKNLKNLTKKEKLAIIEFEELLLEKYPKRLKKLVLFGSKARGNSNRSSDLDILVVLRKNDKRARQEIAKLTHEPILHFKVLLSPIIVEEQFFKEYSPLLERILEEGVPLWTNKRV